MPEEVQRSSHGATSVSVRWHRHLREVLQAALLASKLDAAPIEQLAPTVVRTQAARWFERARGLALLEQAAPGGPLSSHCVADG
jgi:hypothetical protein